jgi:hypothetical protein
MRARYGGSHPSLTLSPRCFSADLNRLRQRRKRIISSRGRGSSTSIEVIYRGTESESSTTSTHASLGRPYTPSLSDDSLRKDSMDSNPNSFDYFLQSFQRRHCNSLRLILCRSHCEIIDGPRMPPGTQRLSPSSKTPKTFLWPLSLSWLIICPWLSRDSGTSSS